jgi:hypothetical protein
MIFVLGGTYLRLLGILALERWQSQFLEVML